MKTVYLFISDLHLSEKNKSSRLDYEREINHVCKIIVKTANKYIENDYRVIGIWIGDLIDRGFRSVDKALKSYQYLEAVMSVFDANFICLGNHEKTYSKNNPFWFLVNSVDSEILKSSDAKIAKGVSPKGLFNKVFIRDKIVDGEIEILFNHYASGIQSPDRQKISIGVFHQDIVFREVMDDAKEKLESLFELPKEEMEKNYGYTYLESSPILVGYNYCFFGHNHKLYGTWKNDDGCILQYLASLGRTNVTEVNNLFLERDIPAMIVEDGVFIREEHNTFELLSRELCIDENSVNNNKKSYKYLKERNKFKSYKSLSEDPIESLLLNLNDDTNKSIILNILDDKDDIVFSDLK